MFIEAKKIIGLSVAAIDEQAKVGTITDILVEPENGNVLGFLVSPGGLLSPKKALSIVDVTDWDPKGIVTRSVENLVPPQEIVRINEILQKRIQLLGMKAKTESGKNLGEVENFLIDSETQSVTKYYLRDILGNRKIFSSDKVSRIDKKIIFSDDVIEPPQGAVGAPAA